MIIIPILWGAYKGFQRGFLLTIISIFSFVIAIILGLKFFQITLQLLAPYTNLSKSILVYLAFFITFLLSLFLVNKLGNFIKNTVHYTLLGSVDSLIGALVGGLRFALIVSIVLWGADTVGLIAAETKEQSVLFKYIAPLAPACMAYVSQVVLFGQDIFQSIKNIIQNSATNPQP